jgi:hypothetical protein
MVTEQGERFEADRELYINLPLAETAQWTPRHGSSAADQDVDVATRPREQLTDQNSLPSANRSAIPTNNASPEPALPANRPQPPRPKWSPFREDMR